MSIVERAERSTAEQELPLPAFHEGRRDVLEECYRRFFPTVERAVATLLLGADKETIIHEVFMRLISSAELRASFRGGAFGPWIATVARNHARDFLRRQGRMIGLDERTLEREAAAGNLERQAEARQMVQRFREQHVPAPWQGVFELRFLQQLPQREAAAELKISRTTLAYRELRLRAALKRFLLDSESP